MFQLIINYQEQFYSFPDSFIQIKKEQGGSFFYYHLQPINKEKFKKFSLQKILMIYPQVKTFLPLTPFLQKKEYKPFWKNLLPMQDLENQKIYLQLFPINDRQARFACYHYKKSNDSKKILKNLPLFSTIQPAVSYFLSALLVKPPKQNIAICFDGEILLVQKFFSEVKYFPNLQNLPIEQFFQAVKNFSNIEIYDTYFFLIQHIKREDFKQSTKHSLLVEYFFTTSLFKFLKKNKLIAWRIRNRKTLRKNNGIFLLLFFFMISFLFGFFFVFETYFTIQTSKVTIFELRKQQIDEGQRKIQKQLFVEGFQVIHNQLLQQLSQVLFSPKKIIEILEKIPLEKAWLLSFQEDITTITLQVTSLNANFWAKNKKDWEIFLNKDITLLKDFQQNNQYQFILEIKK